MTLTPSLEDITSLMCGIAADSEWKRGKRNFMIVDRDMLGTKIQVRFKANLPGRVPGGSLSSISLVTANWRVLLKLGEHFTGNLAHIRADGFRAYMVPSTSFSRPPKTVIGIRIITEEPEFDIHSVEVFEREWTLLKLFSSEWSDGE